MVRSGVERLQGRFSRYSAPAILCTVGVVACVALCVRLRWTLDDAYITFAYAKSWLHGDGVVFNAGERVEGYTSFSWVAASLVGMWLGIDVEAWSWALGTLAAAGTVVAAWALTRALLPEERAPHAGFAALLVGTYAPFAFWGASGMETTFFSLLITVAMWRYVKSGPSSWSAPLVTALAALTRPEGMLLSFVLSADAGRRTGWRGALTFLGRFATLFAPYFLWRFWYYGQPLPNTFYAKVGGSFDQLRRGATYLVNFLFDERAALIVFLAAVSCFDKRARRALPVQAFLGLYVTYVVAVGGDVFPSSRFLVTAFPLFTSLAVVASSLALPRLRSPVRVAAAFGVALTIGWVSSYPMQTERATLMNNITIFAKAPCSDIRRRTAPSESIATLGVGVLKFCTDRRVIDMLGLTDAHIARVPAPHMGRGCAGHERYDSRYVLAEHPAFIVVPPPTLSTYFGCTLAAVKDIWQQPEIGHQYVLDHWGLRRADVPAWRERRAK